MLDLIRRFHTALPQVRGWIDQYIAAHAASARSVGSLGFKRLNAAFGDAAVGAAKVVSVDWVQFPPVNQFGLPEFANMQQMAFDGITFRDTFFLKRGQETESLHFHEMVHVAQWRRLGIDHFLLAYGLGLAQHGYERSPLEAMAYALQRQFDAGTVPPSLVEVIEQQTDAVWSRAATVVLPP